MKHTRHIISALVFLPLLVSCAKVSSGQPDRPELPEAASGDIDASCSVIQIDGGSGSGKGVATRTIIGQTTIASIDANFIKLNESLNPDWKSEDYAYTEFRKNGWNSERTMILDASILSSPDNTEDIHFRSIVFNPRQTYTYRSYDRDGNPDTEDEAIVGYVSRMVGWYPKTLELETGEDGTPAVTEFIGSETHYHDAATGQDCVVFKNRLDGKTDVMMTDMREGRYDLREFGQGFRNNASDRSIQPYGHMFYNSFDASQGYQYLNYFSFRHYLTGIRFFIRAVDSDLSLIGWKQITDVVFTDQPSTVTIALPVEQNVGNEKSKLISGLSSELTPYASLPVEGVYPVFGEPVSWTDPENMPIIRDAMAEDDPDHPEFAMTSELPIEMEHAIAMDKTYLGYMLIQPDRETEFELHTDAGVFSGKIPVKAKYVDQDGNTQYADILQPGHIYDIVIDIKTDGSLDVIIGNEDFESFRNLAPHNDRIPTQFEYSNCYVITPGMMDIRDENGADTGEDYAGFYFQAMVAGRGDTGLISAAGADLYPDELYFDPRSVRILWQDTDYLITHAELVHGYVRFTLNEKCKTEGLKGNAVLAVYDKEGDIIWSWHIWVTDGLEDIEYEIGGRSFAMMNMNLGATASACSDGTQALSTYGLYYQWGRKDPLPVPPTFDHAQSDRSTKTYYYMDQGALTEVEVATEPTPTVETGARHPLDIIRSQQLGSYQNDWLFASIDQLWGYSTQSGTVLKKTIYDPCPYGYRVADDELQTLLGYCKDNGSFNQVSGKYGINIPADVSSNGIANFFPYSGWRGRDTGRTDKDNTWFGVGQLGDYQDARVSKDAATMNHRGRTLLVKDGNFHIPAPNTDYNYYINPGWGNRSSASPVRCVRYDDPDNSLYPEEPASE